jgi:hypothetical protein
VVTLDEHYDGPAECDNALQVWADNTDMGDCKRDRFEAIPTLAEMAAAARPMSAAPSKGWVITANDSVGAICLGTEAEAICYRDLRVALWGAAKRVAKAQARKKETGWVITADNSAEAIWSTAIERKLPTHAARLVGYGAQHVLVGDVEIIA